MTLFGKNIILIFILAYSATACAQPIFSDDENDLAYASELLSIANEKLKSELFRDALPLGIECYRISSSLGDAMLEAGSALLLCKVYMHIGQPYESLEYGLRSADAAKSLDAERKQDAYIALVHLFDKWKLPEKCLEYIAIAEECATPDAATAEYLDEVRIKALEATGKYAEAIIILDNEYSTATKIGDIAGQRSALIMLSDLAQRAGNLDKCERYENLLLHHYRSDNNTEGAARCLNNLGMLCIKRNVDEQALELFREALAETPGNSAQNCQANLNIAFVYMRRNEYAFAQPFVEEALAYTAKWGDAETACRALISNGWVLYKTGDSFNAMTSASEAMKISALAGDNWLQADALDLLARIKNSEGLSSEAEGHIREAEKLRIESEKEQETRQGEHLELLFSVENKEKVITWDLASKEHERMVLEQQLADTRIAAEMNKFRLEKELDQASLLNEQAAKDQAMKELALLHAALKVEKQANQIFSLERDSVKQRIRVGELAQQNLERDRGLVLLQKENELLASRQQLKEAELKRNEALQNLGITAGSMLFILLVLASTGWASSRKKNKLIAEQSSSIMHINEELQERNYSIISGINYASYFQASIMPDETEIRSHMPDGFMMHMPLDIVSGDIPYLERKGNNLYIGAIDCIGHGVPAAMLSFMVHYNLKELVNEKPNFSCGELLQQLHQKILKALKHQQQKTDFAAGVDLALCRINLDRLEIQFAGAQLPMLIIGKNNKERIKGEPFSIGDRFLEEAPHFINHDRKLSKTDRVYLCTDGFIHQLGGSTGTEKYSMMRMMRKLHSLHHQPMGYVKEDMIRSYKDWKGTGQQTDDIMLLGISFDR